MSLSRAARTVGKRCGGPRQLALSGTRNRCSGGCKPARHSGQGTTTTGIALGAGGTALEVSGRGDERVSGTATTAMELNAVATYAIGSVSLAFVLVVSLYQVSGPRTFHQHPDNRFPGRRAA